jgi:hypothetical protein
MSNLSVNTITDASGGTTATINGYTPTVSNMAGRNRIINGAMMIDQRNAGAQISNPAGGVFTVDRWSFTASQATKFNIKQNLNSVTPPAGFTNYLGLQVSNAVTVGSTEYFFLGQAIEGFNTADLNFGTANAATVTLSFWVYSSLTGTFGGSLQANASARAYAFNYTISSANTWEKKTITVAGDTTGTWVGATNGIGMNLYLGLGIGSNYTGSANTWSGSNTIVPTGTSSLVATANATFYITGVQLEKGSVATPFDYRQYGTELALCQRYYQHYVFASGGVPPCSGVWRNSTRFDTNSMLPVVMRSTPTIATTNIGNINVYAGGSAQVATAISDNGSTASVVGLNITVASGGTDGRGGYLQASGATAGYTLSSEL